MAQVNPELFNAYAKYFAGWLGFPENYFIAQAMKESSYDPNTGYFRNVCNSYGSCGILQIQRAAITDVNRVFKTSGLSAMDPIQSLVVAALYMVVLDRYLRYYSKYSPLQYGDWQTLAVAYNGGINAGRYYVAHGYAPSYEGRNYIAFINNNLQVA